MQALVVWLQPCGTAISPQNAIAGPKLSEPILSSVTRSCFLSVAACHGGASQRQCIFGRSRFRDIAMTGRACRKSGVKDEGSDHIALMQLHESP